MSEIKAEDTNTNTTTTRNSKNNKIDISPILKDVEQCIQIGLNNKLESYFCEFETYEKTHNEVLSLSVVKNLVNHNNILTRILTSSACKKEFKQEQSRDTVENSSSNLEVSMLKQEILHLQEELSSYKNRNSGQELSTINLEIKEKQCNCACTCKKNEDINISIVNKMLLGQNVKNVILQENQKEAHE